MNRLGNAKIKAEFNSQGLTILNEPKKLCCTTYVDCIDKEFYKYRMKHDNLYKTHQKFVPTNPFTIENIKNYLLINDINLELLSDKYVGCNKNLKWRCECGNVFYRSLDTVKYKKSYKCLKCVHKQSQNETVVCNFLDKYSILYYREYRFGDCIGSNKDMPFDFYLPNKNICIEIDGEQHFEPIRFGGMKLSVAKNRLKQ